MPKVLRVSLIGVLMVAGGCMLFVPQETRFLQAVQGRATQDEVRQRLGAPAVMASAPTGESIWVYRVREEEPGNRWTSTGLWCDEYVLTFDRQAVLQRWTHKSQFHGGELMPPYCVAGGYQPQS